MFKRTTTETKDTKNVLVYRRGIENAENKPAIRLPLSVGRLRTTDHGQRTTVHGPRITDFLCELRVHVPHPYALSQREKRVRGD